MRLEFHPEAELELIEAAAYYEREVPGTARCKRRAAGGARLTRT